jgi:2-polyprenyl-3-methyl-5-hydroxy-6-metoxy-1,4-benzoquinol methylase
VSKKQPDRTGAEEFQNKGRTYCGYDEPEYEKLAVGRYLQALKFIKESDVCLDAASGSGYGTAMVAVKAREVIGLEIDDQAIAYAQKNFGLSNITYKQADLTKNFDLPSNYFDAVISIETLEHITDHDTILSEFHRVLKPEGLLIASTVEHHVYSELGGIHNKHHIGEMTKKELLEAISRYFKPEDIYGQQRYIPLSLWQKVSKKIWVFSLIVLGKIDIFKLRYPVGRLLHLDTAVDTVNTGLSVMQNTGMEKTDFTDHNDFYQLMVIARKIS